MTARMLATLALALGLTALNGCSGGKDDTVDTDTEDTDEPEVETAETGDQGPEYFTPAMYTALAGFGWDLSTNSLVEVTTDGYTLVPSIFIIIGNQDYLDQIQVSGLNLNASTDWCFVELTF